MRRGPCLGVDPELQLVAPVLLRCIVGNPFRPVVLRESWRTPDVIALARSAYDEREMPSGRLGPMALAVLADALEDAGCGEPEVVHHLRRRSMHVRGCWVVHGVNRVHENGS